MAANQKSWILACSPLLWFFSQVQGTRMTMSHWALPAKIELAHTLVEFKTLGYRPFVVGHQRHALPRAMEGVERGMPAGRTEPCADDAQCHGNSTASETKRHCPISSLKSQG
ncbi:hypothetical protein QBC37DRAFT_426759 [Rhypophila decipiens]|uniref:Secreted protein n=1 Tax=Rhypophila decipiens TaxID=261697 RepID=A0AAN6Y5D6_9PEZI|nr:hypothetical protein QBC37DRAFT_426759 [Rhypophila decipiens]